MEDLAVIRRMQKESPDRAILAHALAVLQDRISRLSDADRNDLFALQQCLYQGQDEHERDEVFESMMEILDQRPQSYRAMNATMTASVEPTNWMKHVGALIKEYREKAGMTQTQLAEKAGIPQSHVCRLENMQHSPTRATLLKIANALGVELKVFDPTE